MASNNNSNIPTGKGGLGVNFLPDIYQSAANKKFLQATIDQLYQPGTVTKTSGFIGRQNAKAAVNTDVYVQAADQTRQDYQLEPGLVIKDTVGNVKFFKDYIDYINQIGVFGGNTTTHPRLNTQEFYSWDPHFDWDKFSNFQNYYWLPYGPQTIKIYGQQQNIISTYSVEIQNEQGTNEYLFTPNGLDLNPVLKLYRGQTYNFNIVSNSNPFSIMTARSLGSNTRYTTGVTNNGIESGVLTFTVPIDAPSLLYYQSETDINLGGAIEIFDVVDASTLDVVNDILGKHKYVLHDGTTLSNGMKIAFGGNVIPAKYATGQYYVEGVGTAIKLVPESLLEIVSPYTDNLSIEFDQTPFDIEPFDDATGFASIQDYIVINRSSRDHNPWSRYNRWFHKDVITASAIYNNDIPSINQAARAIRPIIEFEADLKLFNLGTTAIADIDLIDDFTTDVFSNIEGSLGYNIDGIPLSTGQRILFTADTDPLVQNKIYQVEFINIRGRNQIHLVEVITPVLNQVTLVLQGATNQSQMYWFDGTTWIKGQQKTKTNQAPLFDIVDNDGISFSNASMYNGSTFAGTKLFSYKVGTGIADTALGFPLSYLNVSNIGDIVFNFDLGTDSFEYKVNNAVTTSAINTGYLVSHDYAGNTVYVNGWQTCAADTVQAAIRIYTNSKLTNNFNIDIFDVTPAEFHLDQDDVRVYINDNRVAIDHWNMISTPSFYQIVFNTPVALTDIITIKVYSGTPINSNGYYEIPINLQNNPLNNTLDTFTLGEVRDHVNSIIDNIYNPEQGDDATDIDNLPILKSNNDVGGVTFIGTFPGTSNLRDLGNITQYGTKFVQHSGPLSLALYHITSESNNIVRAIETARDDYNSFKRNFITVASSLGIDADPITLVDLTLQKINANKPNAAPYYFSDMVPYGASITTKLQVVDYRIKTYPLSAAFSLDTLSNKSVLVYQTHGKTKTQLVHGRDYTFNNQAMVVIDSSVTLSNGDTITTVEYDSTDGCFVPETPTKLGIWPAYVPQIYSDTTLLYTPQNMIQGHDGSVILSYGDYRDAMLLELETRIYNNIKVKYDPSIFDIADVIPGYNRTTNYNLTEFNQVLAPTFYKWTGLVGVDFTQPLNFDTANSFTYNYSADVMPDGNPAPGYWRGIYRYMLDTDRPHLCPWEMLGFSEQPDWWSSVYGTAPYTRDNLVMWEDLSTGTVRKPGAAAVVLPQYVRPFLIDHIPVDEAGNLISPLDSGLTSGIISPSANNNFIFGDVGPVESAWRRSSYYPFSVLITSMLLTPAKTFGTLLDRSRIIRNVAGQLIYKDTGLRISPTDIVLPSIYSSNTRVQTAGIINYVVDLILNVIFSNNIESYNNYKSDLASLTPQLSYRVGAFTNQPQFNLLLESKTPLATGSVFIPTESYNIFLNTSSPVKKLTYSGIIITKLSTGFEVKGYSKSQPYFNYYDYLQSGSTVNVGGISEGFVTWTPGQQYIIGQIVQYGSTYYRATANVTAGQNFDPSIFVQLTQLPIVGGATAQFRKSWDKNSIKVAPYGTTFTTIQEVVDFMLGYEQWLIDQGFVFDNFNNNLASVTNWSTSAKEFMFWTTQNWSSGQDKWSDWLPNQEYTYGTIVKFNGNYYSAIYNIASSDVFDVLQWNLLPGLSNIGSSVISLSPAAGGVTFTTNLTVVDSIGNTFNDYEIFKVDGTPMPLTQLSSYRNGNTVTYTSKNTDGIYCASFYLIQNEHVALIDNVDIFNDVIYNPPTGYRRDRIKLSGYITTGWYGGLDIPGFIFDAATVEEWQAWKDYNMADIVVYQGYYYSARAFTAGTSTFIAANWIQLSSKPQPQILPNWTNAATQFTDFYSLEVDSFDNAQQTMAHHLVGYQKRQYLNNIIQDSVSEFKFYQGMIREKGTQNVLNQLFGVLNSENKESLSFYEEWALRVGQYGAANAFENIEIILDASVVKNNPQGYLLSSRIDSTVSPFVVQQTPNDIYVKPLGYNSNPFPVLKNATPLLRSAGYVDPLDATFNLGYISEIVNQDITKLSNGQYVWCAFEGPSWNIYRFTDLMIRANNVTYDGTTLTITTDNIVPVVAGSYVGFAQSGGFDGFYQVATVTLNSFTVLASNLTVANPYDTYNELVIYALITQRTSSLDTLDSLKLTHLTPGSIIWVDNNGSGLWANYTYNPVFNVKTLTNPTPANNFAFGKNIAVNSQASVMTIGNSQGTLYVYDKVGKAIPWERRGAINAPFLSTNYTLTLDQIATVVAISDDGTWLASGSPLAGQIHTNYQGTWSTGVDYVLNNVVVYNNTYYQALQASYNQTPSTVSLYWKIIPYIAVDKITGDESHAYAGQGVVSIYKKDINNNYSLIDSIVSPTPSANENFGSTLVFGNNVLYVSALGHNNNTGCVYKLSYKTTIEQTTTYNPVGSSAGTLVVTSTSGIRAGMFVQGTGFVSSQQVDGILTKITFASSANIGRVVSGMSVTGTNILPGTVVVSKGSDILGNNYIIVISSQDMNSNISSVEFNGDPLLTFIATNVATMNTLLLSGSPDSTPAGVLTFVSNSWTYDFTETYIGASIGSNFGSSLVLSQDGNTFAIASTGNTISGKVNVYRNTGSGLAAYQTLTGTDTGFGRSISISPSGNYLAVSDDHTSAGTISQQGSVTIYSDSGTSYTALQSLVNHYPESSGLFGNKIAFMNNDATIVVYSKYGDTSISTTFDSQKTTFDKSSTNFITLESDNGKVDVYDRYNTKWVFSESLETTNQQGDAYGTGFTVANNQIFVSATTALDQGLKSGQVYSYEKLDGKYTWTISRAEVQSPDISKIKKAFLYNRAVGKLVTYLDVIDSLQGKIAGPAQEEIQYQTFYDPAEYSYSNGTVPATVNTSTFWTSQTVGQLWWDLRTTKFIENHFDDASYRNNTWNTLAPGASVDIYEWVSYNQLPAVWDAKADTPAGLAAGISGTSLYGNSAYCITQTYDNISKSFTNTYYFWVKNKKIIPSNISSRNMAASEVASLIASPRAQGYACLGLTGTNSFSLINLAQYLKDTDVVLAIEYWLTDNIDQNIHSQWKLISNDSIVDLPAAIEQKWFDSLCGIDQGGRQIPDPTLPVKLRYGIENRPRQGMFVNRVEALKEFIERVNLTILSYQVTESKNISALTSYDPAPSTISGLYDKTIDTDAELIYVNAVPFSQPIITPIIIDGAITGINIVNPGNGYVIAPFITIAGSGEGAIVKATINAVGQITGATVINGGMGYDSNTQCLIRSYSVLVLSDSTSQSTWSIYSYDLAAKLWSKVLTQAYDVRNYWSYVDWFATGYNQFSSADYAVNTFVELNSIKPTVGEMVKVLTANAGGWLLLEKYVESTSVDWTQSYNVVGIQNGTIQFSKSLYEFTGTDVGYDASIFDGADFDVEATKELRIILNTIKNNILIDDLKTNYLDLFFSSIRYAHREQPFIDWIFKTSFIRATHNVGTLSQPVNYPVDNLSNFQDYVSEVKPYRTKVREYISDYTYTDPSQAAVTDFDLQSNYENGSITAIGVEYKNNSIQSFDQSLKSYPWKFWNDNLGFTVTEIVITNGGSGYANIPQVIISQPTGPNPVTAVANAYIANGKVNRVLIISNGSGYLSAPTITFNGGLGIGGVAATASAIIGDSVVRSNYTALKFDRVNQTYYISNLKQTDTFTGSGSRLQFPLLWAPDVTIGTSSVTVNGSVILRELYKLAIVKSTTAGYTQYSGNITFTFAPASGSNIIVTYNKDVSVLGATDRIQYYYNPVEGQLGKDLSQLMTGIDYGGTIVSGLGFNVSGGWGSNPYYTESWDNRDPSFNDYTVQVPANTHSFTLPYTPASGTEINIYYVKNETISYTSNGTTLGYTFNINLISPSVNITSTTTTVNVSSTYNPTGSVGYILRVASTAGIVPGMVISGTGFNSRQKVVRIIDSTTLNISPVPDSTPSGTLTFSNTSGGFILTVASVAGLEIGNIVSSSGSAFSYNTTITAIDSVNNCITLSNIILTYITAGTEILFTQQLVQPTDLVINANGTILLNAPAPVGAIINISGSYRPTRLDDPHYGTINQTNTSAIMITPIADGVSSTFAIPNTFVVNDGDEFILRQSTSEGAIAPSSTDYDSAIDGGDMAYSTASGLLADDIVLDGDGLVTPTSSPAPEEVVPGQVVDTLAIKVYDQAQSGAADIKVNNHVTDGVSKSFPIGQLPNSSRAIIVKLGTNIKTFTTDYTVDYANKLVVFNSVPAAGQTVSIFSVGFNGNNILDIDYFVGDGTTTEFVTKANWVSSVTSLVYVNGIATSPTLFKTDTTYAFANAIGLKFTTAPAAGALINFIIVSSSQQTFAITRTETVSTNGSLTYSLQYPIGNTLPNESNMIVRVDQSILQAPTNSYFTIGKNKLTYKVDSTKAIPYSVPTANILVYAGGNLLTLGIDYTVDPSAISVKINRIVYSTYSGQQLIISIVTNDGYSYNATTGQITFAQAYDNTHIVEVVSSYVQDILDIQRTNIEYVSSFTLTSGTTEFYTYNAVGGGLIELDRPVIDNNYVWVVQGSTLLTPSIDYKLNDDLQSIVLANPPQSNAVISVITFGSNILPNAGISYMQFKDMLNRVTYKRLNANKRTTLVRDLKWNDTTIVVADATMLDVPNASGNRPGIIEIRGERIEYFTVNGNTLGQLRRGTLGTGVYNLNRAGTYVQGIGASETIPYKDTTTTETIISTGGTTVNIGFVPADANSIEVFVGGYNDAVEWTANTDYITGDIVRVGPYTYRCTTANTSSSSFGTDSNYWTFFVGNIRLKKSAYSVFNINNAPYSPAGDVEFPADFTVDGETAVITLTNPLSFGTQVTVVKQNGTAWDSSVNILNDNTAIGNFIKAEPGIWYTEYNSTL